MSESAGPRHLGRFTVLATLGAGAMGEVLRARDERLGREVALKTVKNRFGVAAELFRARFEAEARALAALSHPAIVQVHDLGFEPTAAGEEPYLVMELVDGPSLKARLDAGPLPPAEVRAMGIQLARALEAAHARGILHRDVKPANILLAPGGTWKLADFGVAHVPDSSMTMTGQFLGTPAYAAPEALALGESSAASDVFGLAATLVEAATGARLRGDASLSELVRRSDESIELPASVPVDLARALGPALARDPARRPSAARFAELLAGEATPTPWASTPGLPIATAAVGLPAPARRPTRARLAAYAAAGVLGIGLVAALASTGGDAPPARVPRPSAAPQENAPIRIGAPPGLDGKGAKEWRKVAEKVDKGDYGEALDKLDRFERRFGRSPETAQLRAVLERLPHERDD